MSAKKYNGMKRAGDWEGKRIRATRQIRNGGGKGVMPGTEGIVKGAYNGLDITFDVCEHCGTVTHVNRVGYYDVELVELKP